MIKRQKNLFLKFIQRVWVYTPRTRKGLSKKLMHNWLGPYRIVEKLSLVHFKLRTVANKKVAFSCHANRMKPFVDPNLRPIDSPLFDDPAEPYLDESDIPKDCFEPNSSVHAEENPLDIGLNPVGEQALVTSQFMKRKNQTKNQTKKRQRISFKMKKNQLRKQLLSTIKLCLVQKNSKASKEKRKG